jgi:hypothetical protein
LAVAFVAESAAISDILDTDCREPDLPADSVCQKVYGSYNLTITDDNRTAEEVRAQYTEATNDALEEGKMQARLEDVDPYSPLSVARSSQTQDRDSSGKINKSMGTWQRVFVVLLSAIICY